MKSRYVGTMSASASPDSVCAPTGLLHVAEMMSRRTASSVGLAVASCVASCKTKDVRRSANRAK